MKQQPTRTATWATSDAFIHQKKVTSMTCSSKVAMSCSKRQLLTKLALNALGTDLTAATIFGFRTGWWDKSINKIVFNFLFGKSTSNQLVPFNYHDHPEQALLP
jgi:hypothetical protein